MAASCGVASGAALGSSASSTASWMGARCLSFCRFQLFQFYVSTAFGGTNPKMYAVHNFYKVKFSIRCASVAASCGAVSVFFFTTISWIEAIAVLVSSHWEYSTHPKSNSTGKDRFSNTFISSYHQVLPGKMNLFYVSGCLCAHTKQ